MLIINIWRISIPRSLSSSPGVYRLLLVWLQYMTMLKSIIIVAIWASAFMVSATTTDLFDVDPEAQSRVVFHDVDPTYPSGSHPVLRLRPALPPNLDPHDDTHLTPVHMHTLYHTSSTSDDTLPGSWVTQDLNTGSANSTVHFKYPSVMLRNIGSIMGVGCDDNSVSVAFFDESWMNRAVLQWVEHPQFVLVTNHDGRCDAGGDAGGDAGDDAGDEHGYFLADQVTIQRTSHTLVIHGHWSTMEASVSRMQVSFASALSPVLSEHPTVAPNMSFAFNQMLPEDTILLAWPPFVNVVSDYAYMKSLVVFSGYLDYDLDQLAIHDFYLDVVCHLDTALQLTAKVDAAFSRSMQFASPPAQDIPHVVIPNVVNIGPSIAFSITANISAQAALEATTGYHISVPSGNVHLDLLHPLKDGLTGFIPDYLIEANCTEDLPVHMNMSTELDVDLEFSVGNLIKFNGGFDILVGTNNVFSLGGNQYTGLGDENVATEEEQVPDSHVPFVDNTTNNNQSANQSANQSDIVTPTFVDMAPSATGSVPITANSTEVGSEIVSLWGHPACGENKVELYTEFLLEMKCNNVMLFEERKVLWDSCRDLWKRRE